MLKKMAILPLFVLSLNRAFSQTYKYDRANRFNLDLYYGAPNMRAIFTGSIEDAFNWDTGGSSYIDRVINPCGVRAEYFITSGFSIGLTGMFDQFFLNYKNSGDSIYSMQSMRLRSFLDIGIHLGDKEKVDHAIYFSAGAKYHFANYFVQGKPISKGEFHQNYGLGYYSVFPIACRINYTFRYYFTPILGFHVGLGLGGPLLQAGFCMKFNSPLPTPPVE